MTKRILALLFAATMLLSVLPMMAFAEECTKYVSASGNDATGTGAADAPFATIQKAIDSIPNSGTVILLSDLNVSTAASNNYAFEILDRKDITLDGGGYKVKMNNAVRPFCVSVGKLTLTDVDIDMNGHQYNQLDDSKYTIQVLQDGELVLNDGAIIENAKYGNGFTNFSIRGTATMNDGAIIRNMEGLFGAIRVEGYDDTSGFGNFYMNGGLITGCTSEGYGYEGVVFYISVGGKMVMTGGTITGNQDNAYSPGTIFLHANNMGARGYNEFTATGGTITGNSAIYGGVVYTNNNVNKINISGNVNFTGNTGTEFGGESNLYLGSDLLVNLEGGMGENSMVGVYTSSVPSNTADVKFAFNAAKADAGHFISDKMSTSGIIYDDGEKCWNAAGNEIIGYHHVNEENTLWLSTAAAGYAVDISSEIEHGTVTPNLKCFCPGDTVTLTVNPAEGYQLKSLKYNDGTTDYDITKDATTGNYQFTMPDCDVTVTAEFEAATPTPQYKYTEYENWQIKYGNTWDWSDNMDKVEDGLFKIEILWEGTGFNVASDENPIKKDWFALEELTIGEEVIAPVIVDVYLKVIDDETLEIGVGVVPAPAHTHNPVKVNGQAATETAAGWRDYYECDCGALFEDENGTTPIEDLDAWKSQTGNGYIAPIKPTETGTEPTATGTEVEPTATGTEPTETGTEPTETGTEPTATGTEPTATGTEPTETTVDLRIGDKEFIGVKGGVTLEVESLDDLQDITVLVQNGVDVEGMSEDWSMSTKFLDSEGRGVLEVQVFETGDDYVTFNLQSHYADCPGANVEDFQIMMITAKLPAVEKLLGDANDDGLVNMKDVLTIRRVLADLDVTTYNALNADCNEDGAVDMKDVLELRKYLAGLITELGA